MASITLALAALASVAIAHGTVSGIVADGTYSGGYQLTYYYEKQNTGTYPDTVGWYAENLDNGFIDGTGYATDDITCHKNASPAQISATVAAGGTVDFQWTTWPESHIGPVITYLANCGGDCSAADKSTLQWVKIDAQGLIDASSNHWATTDMISNNNTWTTTIPSSIAAGNYVARHEIIALHGAGSTNGAQNYPQCINLKITGSGTDSLSSGTLGTALYKNTDAGILFNPYAGTATYAIPGPALYSGAYSGGNTGGGNSPVTSAAASAPSTSLASSAATSAAAENASTLATSVVASSTPTSAAAPEVTSLLGAITAAIPSEALPSAVPAPTPSAGAGAGVPSTPLPEGFTMKDLLEWVNYILNNYGENGRRHARAVRA